MEVLLYNLVPLEEGCLSIFVRGYKHVTRITLFFPIHHKKLVSASLEFAQGEHMKLQALSFKFLDTLCRRTETRAYDGVIQLYKTLNSYDLEVKNCFESFVHEIPLKQG